MSDDHEGRIARLERAVTQYLNVDLHEHDDADQRAAHEEQLKADQQSADEQASATAEAEPEPEPESEVAGELTQGEEA